jgi:hypothetical protein
MHHSYSHRVTRAAADVLAGLCCAQQAAHNWKVLVTSVVVAVKELGE